MSDKKFCINCAYSKKSETSSYLLCWSPENTFEHQDYVTGELKKIPRKNIYLLRGEKNSCGIEGSWFKQKEI